MTKRKTLRKISIYLMVFSGIAAYLVWPFADTFIGGGHAGDSPEPWAMPTLLILGSLFVLSSIAMCIIESTGKPNP